MTTQPLENRVIVVIGGTTGIGLSGVHACISAGASLVAVGLDTSSVEATSALLGTRGVAIQGDATLPGAAVQAIALARATFGDFHALYHVAGGSGRKWGDGALHETTDEGWERTHALNETSVFYSNRAAVQAFLELGHGGSILNLTSVLAASPAPQLFDTCAYAAAKAAVSGLTHYAAARYVGDNIRVNAIAPGLVATPMSERAQANDAIMDFVSKKQPLEGGRIGVPSDLDAAVVFFLSDQSRFVTGQVLAIDGGWSVSNGNGA